ncbi:hypothetical protein [Streptomyces sp. NPDC056982]|uniref:hypothetical protein n=1 Tax=Streptomyces sp. NPDC056982 TaxID=3345986 RepID=UPI00362E8043
MRIELHIGRLIFDGIAPGDPAALRTALESELGDLLTRDPVAPRHDQQLHRATPPTITAAADSAVFGRHIARAVHGSLRLPLKGNGMKERAVRANDQPASPTSEQIRPHEAAPHVAVADGR